MLSHNLFFKKESPNLRSDNPGSSGVDPDNLGSVLPGARQQAGHVRGLTGTATGIPHTDSAIPLEADIGGAAPGLDATIGSNRPAPRPDAGGAGDNNEAEQNQNNQQQAADDEDKDKKKKLKEQANTYPNGEYWYGALLEMLQNDDLPISARKTIGTALYMAADLVTNKATKGNNDWMGLQEKISTACSDLIDKAGAGAKNAANKGAEAASQLFGKFRARDTGTAPPADPLDGIGRAVDAAPADHQSQSGGSTPRTPR